MAIHPVILCGGAGTRLWPASRADRPKQFLPLLGERSSFQDTLLRVVSLPDAAAPVVVTGAHLAELVQTQAAQIGVSAVVLIEPEARDSAPAVAAAAAHVLGADPDGVVLMLAADHDIPQVDRFQAAALQAVEAARAGYIATFGVPPTHPATGFGYIRPGEPATEGSRRVAAFVEKPDLETARRYLTEDYLWNSGNFAFRADVLMGELARFEPAIREAALAAVDSAVAEKGALLLDPVAFARATKTSLDYAVMERTDRAVVVAATFSWSDLGAWDAILDASSHDEAGNAAYGDVRMIDSKGSLARSGGPFVGLIGVEDVMVVAEGDAVLVCHRRHAQSVKTLVDDLRRQGRGIADRHARATREGVSVTALAQEGGATVELWTLAPGSQAVLPAGSVQVLRGAVDGQAAGTRLDPAEPTAVTSPEGASLLVTHWR